MMDRDTIKSFTSRMMDNERMRSIGIKPRPVGEAPLVDRAKQVGYALYKRAQRLAR